VYGWKERTGKIITESMIIKSEMDKLIFASSNKGKVREVKDIFRGTNFRISSLNDLKDVPEIIEDGITFKENALKKAKIIFEKYGLPTIADDSGLVVEQLDGRPGVYSARYAGEGCTYEDNNRKLLKELSGFPAPHKATFICFAVYLDNNKYLETSGEVNGIIINEIKGKQGFGYDPVFLPGGFERTMAELSLKEKNKISHRSKAFNQLKELLIYK
jgi:XTP/dITP diphosphohydrolase